MKLKKKLQLINHLNNEEKDVLLFNKLDPRNYKAVEKYSDYIQFKSLKDGQVISLRW